MAMQLWLLQKAQPGMTGEWGYDCNYGHVIRAESEAAARKIASSLPGDEGAAVWLDPAKTTCAPLTADGPEEIIMSDFAAG